MLSPIQSLALQFSNALNKDHVNVGIALSVNGWDIPDAPQENRGTLVFGATMVSGALAAQAAHLAAQGKTGRSLYFLGGVQARNHPLANKVMQAFGTHDQIPPARPDEKEGPYMARVFQEVLIQHGGNPLDFSLHIDDQSRHTQANISAAFGKGAGEHDRLVVIGHPAHVLREMATIRKSLQDNFQLPAEKGPILNPVPVWMGALGITPDTAHTNPLARFYLAQEGRKILGPKAPYVGAGYILPISFDPQKVNGTLNIPWEYARATGTPFSPHAGYKASAPAGP